MSLPFLYTFRSVLWWWCGGDDAGVMKRRQKRRKSQIISPVFTHNIFSPLRADCRRLDFSRKMEKCFIFSFASFFNTFETNRQSGPLFSSFPYFALYFPGRFDCVRCFLFVICATTRIPLPPRKMKRA